MLSFLQLLFFVYAAGVWTLAELSSVEVEDSFSSPKNCYDMDAEDHLSLDSSFREGRNRVFCRGDQRFTMKEYAFLQHPVLSRHTSAILPPTSASLQVVEQVQLARVGSSIDIMVNFLIDDNPNSSACLSTSQSPNCNYRSAVSLCQEHLTEPTNYCTINLPPLETLLMDPDRGDVNLTDVTGNFNLVSVSSPLCHIYVDIAPMRAFLLSDSFVYNVQMYIDRKWLLFFAASESCGYQIHAAIGDHFLPDP